MDIKQQIIDCTDALLEDIGKLVKYNSVEAAPLPGMPFGEQPALCLEEALKIAEGLGFRVKNLDNYCGYAEMGEGDEIIGIAGHLDIVPAGEGWTRDPFKLTREGDIVYGRGTTDDKGPIMEALYAVKLIKDSGKPMNKRVRVIFGCNEETGSACMHHYNEVEEPLTMGFTPDANFPCIYGEKGHMGLLVSSKNTKIISMNGGFVSNAVCNQCTTVIPAGLVSAETIKAELDKTPLVSSDVTEEDGKITIFAQGVAAHASMPLLGVNAAGFTMEALKNAGFEDDFVEFYNSRIGTKCDGAGCGINFVDEYGDLTFNNGIVKTVDGVISCTIDIRVPVTVTEEQLRTAIAPYLENEQGVIEIKGIGAPLFCPKESPLVQALYKAYVEVTGDTAHEPMVIGGGTYAKYLPGIIAFGPEMPDVDYRIHNADEFLSVTGIQEAMEVYYKAVSNMLDI